MANIFKKMIQFGENGDEYEEVIETIAENAVPTEFLIPEDATPEERAFILRENAKINLERRIAEKLSRMSETNFEELFNLQEQELQEKRRLSRSSGRRREAVVAGQISFEPALKSIEAFSNEYVDFFTSELTIAADDPTHKNLEVSELSTDLSTAEVVIEPVIEAFVDEYVDFSTNDENAELNTGFPTTGRRRAGQAGRFVYLACAQAGHSCVRLGRFCHSKILRAASSAVVKVPTFFKALQNRFPSFENPGYEQKRTRIAKYLFLNYKRRFVRNEKKASSRMANFISLMDTQNDVIAVKTVKMVVRSNRQVNFAREWAELNKNKLLTGLVVLLSAAIMTVSIINHFTAYVYAYNGRNLGLVKNQDDVLRVLKVVSEQLTREYGTEIEINKDHDITFERVVTSNKDIDDMQEVFNRLTYMQDMNAKAYALYIDNKRVAVLDTEKRAQDLLEQFRDIHLAHPENTDVVYENVSFAEKVDVRQIDTQLGKIDNPKDVMNKMLTGAVAQKVHFVQKGETFSGIAKMYGMSQAELEASNPGITPAKLKIEQQIVLTQAVPLLTVQTVEVATYPDIIPFETIYEDNPKIFKGEQTTKVKGINGEREVTARITRNNGIEVAREELTSQIIKESSAAVISRGTKDPPPLQGTGKFISPITGYRLTSKFGMRNGRMHYGIDMACKTGTRISAADGGTVTFAGYKSSLGYLVIINHGGNKETYYGHCSQLFVKKGDRVYQGQHIANVGSTGRSTGPHCHFEIHVGGVAKNPLSYI